MAVLSLIAASSSWRLCTSTRLAPVERNAAIPRTAMGDDHLILHPRGVGQPVDLVLVHAGDAPGGGLSDARGRSAADHGGFGLHELGQVGADGALQLHNLHIVRTGT